MTNFSRYACGTIAGLVASLVSPLPAAAQRDPEPATLRLSVSTFGGYDTDVTGVAADPESSPSAPYGGSSVALNFRNRTDKIDFSSRGSVDYRNYRTDEPLSAVSYSGNVAVAADVTSRLSVSANVMSLYSPRFQFTLLPTLGNIATTADLLPTALDYGLSSQSTASVYGGGSASLRVSRRSTLNVQASGGTQRLLGENIEVSARSYGGGYSYTMTRYAKLRVGYSQMESDYPVVFQSRRFTQKSIDAGIDYSRPLSVSRRTTFSFGTGSAAIDNGTDTLYTITGNAALRHQIHRSWEANIAYARGLGVVAGFTEPFFADSVNSSLTGDLNSRLSLVLAAGYTNGYIGLGVLNDNYVSYQASTRLEWVARRDRIGVYGSYYYYGYEFERATQVVTPIPRRINRHGVRAGLVFKFPLLQERMRRVTR